MRHDPLTRDDLLDVLSYYQEMIRGLTGQGEPLVPGLTRSESRIVRVLENAQGRLVDYGALRDALFWDRPHKEPDSDVVKVHLARIRQKRPDLGRRIVTVWGEGLRLVPEGGT